MNLARVVEEAAERTPQEPALHYAGWTTSFADLAAAVRRTAAVLAAAGAGAGERVALWQPNHPMFVWSLYGAWRSGATVVPVHSELTEPEAAHILADSGSRVLVCGPAQLERARRAVASIEDPPVVIPTYSSEGVRGLDALVAEERPVPAMPDDDPAALALIAYTSGTSGRPKGAMLTHANLRANLDQMKQTPMAIGPDDVTLCVLPLFHIYGLNVVLNLSLEVGARIVLLERFDPREALDAIEREGVTVLAAAPPAYVAWLSVPEAAPDAFASVRLAISGAAPLPREVLNSFTERFDMTIWEGYGLTETSPALTSTRIGGVAKPGSIGRPIAGVEIRLVTEEGDEAEDGDPGEVLVRGPNVFGGYWNKPDESAAAFSDGWFRTGDIAVRDADGDLFLVDRRRDMIIVSGFNVYPREVEEVLLAHPGVADAAVVGAGDPYAGERVRAIVVLREGAEVDDAELAEHSRRSLAPYKVPSSFEFAPAIPRNAAGKVLRRELRD